MQTTHARSIIAFAVCALAACGGGAKEPAKPEPVTDPVAEMTRLKDEICACQDTGCAERVAQRLEALGAQFEGSKITAEQSQIVEADAQQIADCVTRLAGSAEDERVSPSDN